MNSTLDRLKQLLEDGWLILGGNHTPDWPYVAFKGPDVKVVPPYEPEHIQLAGSLEELIEAMEREEP